MGTDIEGILRHEAAGTPNPNPNPNLSTNLSECLTVGGRQHPNIPVHQNTL